MKPSRPDTRSFMRPNNSNTSTKCLKYGLLFFAFLKKPGSSYRTSESYFRNYVTSGQMGYFWGKHAHKKIAEHILRSTALDMRLPFQPLRRTFQNLKKCHMTDAFDLLTQKFHNARKGQGEPKSGWSFSPPWN